jgi:hypothetical protein
LQVPPEAAHAVALAADYIRAHGLDVGELATCQRVAFGPGVAAHALRVAPDGVRGRVGELLAWVPQRQQQPHWQIVPNVLHAESLPLSAVGPWIRYREWEGAEPGPALDRGGTT